MSVFDQLLRLPLLRPFLRRITRAQTSGRDDVVRHLLDEYDLADIGSSRGSWFAPFNDQPYVFDERLVGDQLPWTVRRMFTTDAKVQMAVRAMLTTALTAEFEWRRGRDTKLAVALAERANQDFGWGGRSPRMDRAFAEVVEEMMLVGPAVGFCYHEASYGLRRVDGALSWMVSDYLYRPPEAHQRFVMDGDRFVSVRQRDVGGTGERDIPAHKLLLMGYGAASDNLWGTGWARAAYPWVVLKEHFRELAARNGQREALGGLWVKFDKLEAERHGYSPAQIKKMLRTAREAAAQWSQGALSWLLSAAGLSFDKMPTGGANTAAAIAIITQANQEILAACVGAALLELGIVAPGNRAIGEIFSDKLVENVGNILDQFGLRLGGRLGPGRGTATRVHDINAGYSIDPADYPTAVHKGLRPSPLAQALGQFPALRAAGFVTPTDRLEEKILAAVGEAMDDAARRSVSDRLAGANNEVVGVGPAGTADGLPASPDAVADAVDRLEQAA